MINMWINIKEAILKLYEKTWHFKAKAMLHFEICNTCKIKYMTLIAQGRGMEFFSLASILHFTGSGLI